MQQLKAISILSIEEGIVICFKDSQKAKALNFIDFRDEGDSNVTCESDLHSSNEAYSMVVTDEGIEICFNEVHLKKENSPIKVTEEGIRTSVRDEHSLKAFDSIDVTEDGIDIFCSNLNRRKA